MLLLLHLLILISLSFYLKLIFLFLWNIINLIIGKLWQLLETIEIIMSNWFCKVIKNLIALLIDGFLHINE